VVASHDGVAWANRSSATTRAAGDLHGVAFGAGHFLAVGDNGAVLDSADGGATWARRDAGTTRTLRAVAFGDNTFVVAGDFGVIAQSDPVVVTVTTTPAASGGGCSASRPPACTPDDAGVAPGALWLALALLSPVALRRLSSGPRRARRIPASGAAR
jgi:hypothetical protein